MILKMALAAGFLALSACAAAQDPLLTYAEAGISQGYPGMALIAETSDGRMRMAAAGVADAEHGVALRPTDQFHIGSITKVFTAIATLQLVDEGRLSLDSTLSSLLGSSVEHIPNSDVITVSQLLDHSSNIYPTNNDPEYISSIIGPKADPAKLWSPEEFIALADVRKNEPTGKPGDGHSYSDTNYTLLGMIIARVSGIPLKDYVKERIFEPLQMTSTYFYSDVLAGARKPTSMVQGYLIQTNEIREVVQISSIFPPVPQLHSRMGPVLNTTLASERNDAAGGIIGTLPDLMKFGDAVFRGKLLSPRSQQFLMSAGEGLERTELNKHRTRTLQAMRKSYGSVIYKEGDGPGGTTTLLAYLPSTDSVFAGFTNSFGYFNEVDFMLDRVPPTLAAQDFQHQRR